MTPRQTRVARGTAAAVVLVAATLAAGTGSVPGPGAAAARAAGAGPATASGRQVPALTAAQRGTTRLGPALPTDPNASPDAYRSCRNTRTPLPGTIVPLSFYHSPDPPAGQQQAPDQPEDFISWGGILAAGISPDEAISSYAGGYANASKLAGAAFVPPVLTVADWRRTYPNPPPATPPYTDPDPRGDTSGIWHSADPSTDSPGGLWALTTTPAADNRVYYCQLLIGQLDDDPTAPFPPTDARAAFPPVRATFLTFGFVPVTATVHLRQQVSGGRLVPITEVGYQRYKHFNQVTAELDPGCSHTPAAQCGFNYCSGGPDNTCSDFVITVTAAVTLRLSDVTVNGTPLDVGSHCQTTGPLYTPGNPVADPDNDRMVLQGGSHPSEPSPQWVGDAAIVKGGAVAGYVTIPPFTGCVTPDGDNLDPLLTAAVSGPGNYVKTTVGAVCSDLLWDPNCTPPTPPFLDGQSRAVPPETIFR
jgi:hypothetical protein